MPASRSPDEQRKRSTPSGAGTVVHLPPRAQAARMGRRAVHQALSGTPQDVIDRIELLVSELVTNSVIHAALSPAESIQMKVEATPGRVRVEVADPGPRFDPARLPGRGAESRGLFLLNAISDRWGMDRLERGKAIWFEVDL